MLIGTFKIYRCFELYFFWPVLHAEVEVRALVIGLNLHHLDGVPFQCAAKIALCEGGAYSLLLGMVSSWTVLGHAYSILWL